MKNFNKLIGNTGEDIASSFLISNNYKIVERNFYSRNGEVDIIAFEKDILCFIEVKTRYGLEFGSPIEAISVKKIINIKRTANYFIYQRKMSNYNARFDIIEIYLNYKNKDTKINLIKDAFR